MIERKHSGNLNTTTHSNVILVCDNINCISPRDYQVREQIPVPYDNLFQSILSFAPRCESYFWFRPHGRATHG